MMTLTVAEALALVALDPGSGKPATYAQSALPHALAGALVVDLLGSGSIEIDDDRSVVATDHAPDAGAAAVTAWESVRDRQRPMSVSLWVAKATVLVPGLPGPVYGQLVTKGILRDEGRHLLGPEHYGILDAAARDDLVARLVAVVDGTVAPAPQDVSVLALVTPCRLAKALRPDATAHDTSTRIRALLGDGSLDGDIAVQVARSAGGAAMGAIAGASGI